MPSGGLDSPPSLIEDNATRLCSPCPDHEYFSTFYASQNMQLPTSPNGSAYVITHNGIVDRLLCGSTIAVVSYAKSALGSVGFDGELAALRRDILPLSKIRNCLGKVGVTGTH